MVLENVEGFGTEEAEICLGDLYYIERVIVDPEVLGWCATRIRQFLVMSLKGGNTDFVRGQCCSSVSSFVKLYMLRFCEIKQKDFLSATEEELARIVGAIRNAMRLGTDKEQEEGVDEKVELDAAVVAGFPELLEKLGEIMTTWEEVSSTMTINEIEEFADKVKMLGEEYGYPPLALWGEGLVEQAGMFELDGMAKTLARYPDLIAGLHSVMEQGSE